MSTPQEKVLKDFPIQHKLLLKDRLDTAGWESKHKKLCEDSKQILDDVDEDLWDVFLDIRGGTISGDKKDDLIFADLLPKDAGGLNLVMTCSWLAQWYTKQQNPEKTKYYRDLLTWIYQHKIKNFYDHKTVAENGTTLLHWAAATGQLQEVSRLLRDSPELNTRDHNKRTPLKEAQWLGDKGIIALLESRKPLVFQKQNEKKPALTIQAQKYHRVLAEARKRKDAMPLIDFFSLSPEEVEELVAPTPAVAEKPVAPAPTATIVSPAPQRVPPVPTVLTEDIAMQPLRKTSQPRMKLRQSVEQEMGSLGTPSPGSATSTPEPQQNDTSGVKFLEFIVKRTEKKFSGPLLPRTKLKKRLLLEIVKELKKQETKDLILSEGKFTPSGLRSWPINLKNLPKSPFTDDQLKLLDDPKHFTLDKAIQFQRNKFKANKMNLDTRFQSQVWNTYGYTMRGHVKVLLNAILKKLESRNDSHGKYTPPTVEKIKQLKALVPLLDDKERNVETPRQLCELRVDDQNPNLLKVLMTHRNASKNPKHWDDPDKLTVDELRRMKKTASYKTFYDDLQFDDHFSINDIHEILTSSGPHQARENSPF